MLTFPQQPKQRTRPGSGHTPEAVLRALDLKVRGRITGLLSGDYRSALVGSGTEFFAVRAYVPGDDVRAIDWNVTARTQIPHVRTFVAEKALTTWIVMDASVSMAFGTADRRKADVAEGVALAIGHLSTRRNNRLGFVTFGSDRTRSVPPKQGRSGLLTVLRELRAADPDLTDVPRGVSAFGQIPNLAKALSTISHMSRNRQLVVVISDFRDERTWFPVLQEAASRNDVICVEIRDPREQQLPDVGLMLLEDPETKQRLRVDTGSAKVRAQFEANAAAERKSLHADIVRAGGDAVTLSTSGDWLRDFVEFVELRKDRVR